MQTRTLAAIRLFFCVVDTSMEQTDLLEQESEQQAPVFQLKGSMLTLTTLELLGNDLDVPEWSE